MNTSELLMKVGQAVVSAMKAELQNNGSIHTSNLVNNIVATVPNPNQLDITMPIYGKYVDEGTKPHMPPVEAIRPWAESKGLNAWAVAMNIKKYGTREHPFIHKFNDTILAYKDEIEASIGQSIGDLVYRALQQTVNK